MEANYFKTDGTEEYVSPANGTDFTLEELQKLVGGYIEQVPLVAKKQKRLTLICNEEGKINELPYNQKATDIWMKYYGQTDFIVGNCLICDDKFIK